MDEFDFINSIKQPTYRQSSVIKGIGDDAAVIRQTTQDTVTAVDTFVEGVHFTNVTMEPFHIGYRAVAANVSDLAAMGATPAFYLVSIVIPSSWNKEELNQIYKGMHKMASIHNMDLIGGDTVSGKELTISVTVIGFADKDKARYRSHAAAGDIVFVTGTLGDSRAGLHILENPGTYKDTDYFLNRHRLPEHRVSFSEKLGSLKRVSLNDVSDGIANEANEIAEASKVSLHIEENSIPVSKQFYQFPDKLQYEWKLFGGEDFELLGTVPKHDWERVITAAEGTNTPVTKIGYVSNQTKSDVYIERDGRKKPLFKQGYTHLK
ncbi:thiamine-phosphate kinase [Virgibacillus kekensis]|uniref:Thiamine-monophosphate kinase n=1 Tax=Virgibacillus kekensis TaxID=202261 RepID=A0ABV9DLY3_9BACI